jgi:hypothetical protein
MIAKNDIKLLLYSSRNDDDFKRLLKAVSRIMVREQIFFYHNLEKFSMAVRDMLFGLGIIVVSVQNAEELEEIYQLQNRLKDHSVIIILDNSIDDLTNRVLQLYPRYIGYRNTDFSDIREVLVKMTTNIQKRI